MIFNFGSGNVDVAILIIDDGVFEVKSLVGDSNFGSIEIDRKVVSYLA